MKTTEAKLLDFLKKSPQFVIPIYQRTYSWTDRECGSGEISCAQAATTPVRLASSVPSSPSEGGFTSVTSQSPLLVIDGQQRLTTVTLLIAGLAKALGDTEPVDGFSPRKLRQTICSIPRRAESGTTS